MLNIVTLSNANYTGSAVNLNQYGSNDMIIVNKCSFISCSSSVSGGAILAAGQNSHLKVSFSLFDSCFCTGSGLYGGGVYSLNQKTASFYRTCFNSCFSALHAALHVETVANGESRLIESSIFACSPALETPFGVKCYRYCTNEENRVNTSNCVLSDRTITFYSFSLDCRTMFCNFEGNSVDIVIDAGQLTTTKEISISFSSFIHNVQTKGVRGLIWDGRKVIVSTCIFAFNEYSKFRFVDFTTDSSVILSDCVFCNNQFDTITMPVCPTLLIRSYLGPDDCPSGTDMFTSQGKIRTYVTEIALISVSLLFV